MIRIFAPQLTNPATFKFETRQNCGNAGATYVMEFNTWEEAQVVEDILNNPIYLWIVNQLRVDARLNKTFLNTPPIAPIEEVLTADQLSTSNLNFPDMNLTHTFGYDCEEIESLISDNTLDAFLKSWLLLVRNKTLISMTH